MTAHDIIKTARALLGELNYGGVVTSSSDTDMMTIETNAIYYLNQALREAFSFSEEFGTYEIDCTENTDDEEFTIYAMPDDFAALDKVINITPDQTLSYMFVGVDSMYINKIFKGELVVSYKQKATEITALTDAVSLDNPLAIEFCNNFVAARIAVNEKPRLVNYFDDLTNEARMKAMAKGPATEEVIGGYYG